MYKLSGENTDHSCRLRSRSGLWSDQSGLRFERSQSCRQNNEHVSKGTAPSAHPESTTLPLLPSLAAVTSFVRRAMTLQAASCWYRAWDSSWRVVCSCCLRVKLCSITASWRTDKLNDGERHHAFLPHTVRSKNSPTRPAEIWGSQEYLWPREPSVEWGETLKAKKRMHFEVAI